ncbi:hypothetical protein M408DRAFT_21345 [Serendipita vermifera MAFF 305830]|uniref:Uncharacterized protein n=1 Tax=Serendipita vermifera MAFF 305830 TaxID=933852 RepID=A0A0C2WYW7_SERVB|nr:hypothetical protein M408DRAFT_21345 [Serendipita vermifera MAFF 305830]
MSTVGTLPLAIRVGLRDAYDSPNSHIQTSLKSLNAVIGYDITLEIAWVDLWNDLQGKFDDKATFVPTITSAVATWLKITEDLLESSEQFQELFMNKMERLRKALFVQIWDGKLPKTEFVRGELLTLFLPKGNPSEFRSISSRIGADLETAFSGKKAAVSHPATSPEVTQDDFVDVSPAKEVVKSANHVRSLPTVATLPRPDNLFVTLLPYTVILRRTGGGIDIESSHQPTLELIVEYFKRHARKNLNDSRQIPYFKIELVASFWGSGTYHDVCRITKEDSRASWINAEITPILAFIEGVCGYDLYKTDGEWIFRRTEPFV